MDHAQAARDTVLVIPVLDRAAIVVTGSDRVSWLNGLVTQDLAKLGPGQATYSLLVEKKGRITADFYVVAAADALVLAVPVALRPTLLETFDHYLIMEDAEIAPAELSFWFAHGPKAAELAVAVSAPYAATIDLLGTGGALIAGPPSLGDALIAGAAARGGALADEATWEPLRIERGLPRFGVEVDPSLYPQEASLEKVAVSFQKGCYLGQEVVYMLENRGHVKKKLVALDLDDGAIPERGDPVTTAAGEAVGDVRSAARGPLRGKPVAIAMVKWAQSKPGTELRLGDRAARVRA